ncbi:hypothetical protein D3C72_1467430 [compost metagenome]
MDRWSARAAGVSPWTRTEAWCSPMTKRLLASSSNASDNPATCDPARSRAETIWFCFRSITARAEALDRKAKDWVTTKLKRALSRAFHRPGRVVAGYSLMARTPA